MAMNEDDFPLKEESYTVIGCAMEVLNALGHGFHEKIYENALVVECNARHIPVKQQQRFEVVHRGVQVGEFVPDLIVYDGIIVDTKTVECIGNHEKGQMLNYLKITHQRVGLIINFKHPRLEWERIVL